MTIFSDKLDRLGETVEQVVKCGTANVAAALEAGRGRLAVSIGSGGSYVTAVYFARCRTTLGLGRTLVMTPMEFVLAMEEWRDAEIWLFSAGANNPDIGAAFQSAAASHCSAIRLTTVRPDGATMKAASDHPWTATFLLPVADPKDGFLATHSMIAMVTALLLASDRLIECSHGNRLAKSFLEGVQAALSLDNRSTEVWFRPGDTLLVLHDPQFCSIATLIETSLWETGIAPVQRTDFRNFAHGRHVWAAKYPGEMAVLALTSCESDAVWTPITDALPIAVRRKTLSLGDGGRFANALGIVHGLALIAHLGDVAGIDPGRPGRGDFAEAIYDNEALDALACALTPAVRHKAAARLLHDPFQDGSVSLCVLGAKRLRDLSEASFIGLALDYDGTVVPNLPTEARLGPPSTEVMDELVRLVDGGVQVGFATGRGGSAGERLREALPERIHPWIVMGYYNGAHVRTLDIDINDDPPAVDDRVAEVRRWILASGLLRHGAELKPGPVQVMIDHSKVEDPAGFGAHLVQCQAVADGSVRVRRSQHSFDIVPAGTTKLKVVDALIERAGHPEGLVLGIGDSGSPLGNDRELISGAHGISVDSVCGSHRGAWTLFGSRVRGPEALAKIF